MRLSIFGGGFGLYGYLPAALSLDWEVATLTKYKPLIETRAELSRYIKKIEFYESDAKLLEFGNAVAFARTPENQHSFIINNLMYLKMKDHVFLEKPLSQSIENSIYLLKNLSQSNVKYSLGYLFTHTDWYQKISQSREKDFFIHWKIPVVESSWKNDVVKGGGLANFYLVHAVPVLIGLGFTIHNSIIDSTKNSLSIVCENQNRIEILAELTSSDDFSFVISSNNKSKNIFTAQTPFGTRPKAGEVDPRIEALKKYLASAIHGEELAKQSYDIETSVISFLRLCYS